jgi:hypothetical protein
MTYDVDGRHATCSCGLTMSAAEAVRHSADVLRSGSSVVVGFEGSDRAVRPARPPLPTGPHSSMAYDRDGNGACSCGARLSAADAARHVEAVLLFGAGVAMTFWRVPAE